MQKKAPLADISVVLSVFLIVFFLDFGQTIRASERSALRPNIVLIFIDALRPDKLGCYGFPSEISPEIDALAGKAGK